MDTVSEVAINVSGAATPVSTRPQFDRMKGAKWFSSAQKKDVMILGQGGIGSWLSLFMCRTGAKIHIFDMDRYEAHNMTGQLVRTSDIGKYKTSAVAEICRLFNEFAQVYANGEYRHDSYGSSIMICAFDNMAARKLAFKNWRNYVIASANETRAFNPDFASYCFFQDGRLKADQLQIFNIPGDRPDLMDIYETEHLFDDAEIGDGDCTFKQTTHCAAMIAGHMTAFYTNWLTNVEMKDPEYTKLPFYYEYIIPFNMTLLK
jgi:hypothetical protein